MRPPGGRVADAELDDGVAEQSGDEAGEQEREPDGGAGDGAGLAEEGEDAGADHGADAEEGGAADAQGRRGRTGGAVRGRRRRARRCRCRRVR